MLRLVGRVEERDPRGIPILPRFHVLRTCGAFTPQGAFLELAELDLERPQAAWREAVFALYLAEDKVEPEVVENMPTWPHGGFSVDQSVHLPTGDQAGIERLVGYMPPASTATSARPRSVVRRRLLAVFCN